MRPLCTPDIPRSGTEASCRNREGPVIHAHRNPKITVPGVPARETITYTPAVDSRSGLPRLQQVT